MTNRMARVLDHSVLVPKSIPSQPRTLPSMLPTQIRHPLPLPPQAPALAASTVHRPPSPAPLPLPEVVSTQPDEFGLYRIFTRYPTHDPDELNSFDNLCDAATFNKSRIPDRDPESVFGPSSDLNESPFAPFPNALTFHLMNFAYTEESMGLAAIQRLNDQVIQQPDFDPNELRNFNAHREAARLDQYTASQSSSSSSKLPFETHAGWSSSSVKISLPCKDHKIPEGDAPKFEVKGVVH